MHASKRFWEFLFADFQSQVNCPLQKNYISSLKDDRGSFDSHAKSTYYARTSYVV